MTPTGSSSRRLLAVVAIVFSVLSLIAFGPAFDAPFDFDDGVAIVENTSIRRLWPPTAIWPGATTGTPVAGRPVVNLSFAVDYAINRWLGVAQSPVSDARAQTIVFHTTNILLHVVVGLLLFGVVRRTLRDGDVPESWRAGADATAAIVACVWLILPIQTEAVNYVTQRSELLVSACYLTTLYAAIRAWEPLQRLRWTIVAVVACVAGMLSKEVMVTAPVVVVLYDLAFRNAHGSMRHRRVLYLALAASAAIAIVGAVGRSRGHSVGFDGPITPWQYLWSQAWAIPHYVRLAFWPRGLAFDYGVEPIDTGTNVFGFVAICAVVIAVVMAWRMPHTRWFGFLGAWFFLLLAPSSSVVPIQTEIAAERRIYLALAALVVLVVLGVQRLLRHRPALVGSMLLTAAVVAAVAVSAKRSMKYRDLVVRWTDGVAATPRNGRAYDNLASALLRLEPPAVHAADSVLTRATAVDPEFAPAWFRKGTIALAERRWADAESLFARTLALDPHHADAAYRLGQLLLLEKRPERAVAHLRAVVNRSENVEAVTQLGLAYLMLRQFDSAAAQFHVAARIDASRNDVQRYRAVALVEQGRGTEAVASLEAIVLREPTSGVSLSLLSLAYAQAGRDSIAARMADSAVANAGGNATAFVFAGRAALTIGEIGDAAEYLRQAVRIDPDAPDALTRLAAVEQRLGNRAMAQQLYARALAIAPDDSAAREGLKR